MLGSYYTPLQSNPLSPRHGRACRGSNTIAGILATLSRSASHATFRRGHQTRNQGDALWIMSEAANAEGYAIGPRVREIVRAFVIVACVRKLPAHPSWLSFAFELIKCIGPDHRPHLRVQMLWREGFAATAGRHSHIAKLTDQTSA